MPDRKPAGRPPRPVVLVDKMTMKVVKRFGTVHEAARFAGIPYQDISIFCKQKMMKSGRLIWRFEDEYDPDEDFTGKYNRPVLVTDCLGRATAYENISEAALAFGVSADTIGRAINGDLPEWYGFTAEYLR